MDPHEHEFGRILDELEREGRLDDTLIIIVSDNGASGEGAIANGRRRGRGAP